jgi:hypothetical protein
LLLLLPMILAILIGVRWNLSVVLICISYNQGSWTLLQVFMGHLYLFLWEFPVWFMYPFRHWDVDSLGIEFLSFL